MFEQIRSLGRRFQAKYEQVISSRSFFGFSDQYANAIKQIEEKKHGEAA